MPPRDTRDEPAFLATRADDPPSSFPTTAAGLLGDVPGEPSGERPRSFASLPAFASAPRTPRLDVALRTLARAVAIAVLSWALLFNFSEVRGSSMEPGIHDRDRIIVDHFSYLFTPIERGDIIVLRYPLDPSLDYIKRVVGLPGDEIYIDQGEVWINGRRVDEPYVSEEAVDRYTHMSIQVKPEHYFVLGDNRLRSSDSREFGQVPREYVRGKVCMRVWPLLRAGIVD